MQPAPFGKRVKNIIFDLDGTLVDSVAGIQWSVEAAMEACGMWGVCPDLTPMIGPPIRTIIAEATETKNPLDLDRLEGRFRAIYDTDGWRRTRCQPGVPHMLKKLRTAGATLSIVTNKPSYATNLILKDLGIAGYFREIVCRDSASPPFGSKAAMLTDLLDRRAMPLAESIMVGDTMEDCHAAAEARIACALVSHGYGARVHGAATEGDLPNDSRRIAGWDELIEWCLGGVLPEVCVAKV